MKVTGRIMKRFIGGCGVKDFESSLVMKLTANFDY